MRLGIREIIKLMVPDDWEDLHGVCLSKDTVVTNKKECFIIRITVKVVALIRIYNLSPYWKLELFLSHKQWNKNYACYVRGEVDVRKPI